MIQFDDTTNESKEYKEFIEKFKPKKTTDDCYTPQNVMDAVTQWAIKEYELQDREIIRPFWPGEDFQKRDYPDNSVVIDNPPFSILSKICKWYDEHGVDYFLFAPALTLFDIASGAEKYVVADCPITYENGALVNTSYVTNLSDYKIYVAPELRDLVKIENDKNTKPTRSLQKYIYPINVVTSKSFDRLVRNGQTLKIKKDDCYFIRSLDEQRKSKKALFGAGFLLSERAAAERASAERAVAAAAERANVTEWNLSEREKEIIKNLG